MKLWLTPAALDSEEVACSKCGHMVRYGTTQKGNPARFDALPPHRLHVVGCSAEKEARKRVAGRPRGATPVVRFGTLREGGPTEAEQVALDARIRATLEGEP